jgi:hypothetical protein
MEKEDRLITILLFIVLGLCVLGIFSGKNNHTGNVVIVPCLIDSVSVYNSHSIIPRLETYKYWTNCDKNIISKEIYKVGDTIEIKIITYIKDETDNKK